MYDHQLFVRVLTEFLRALPTPYEVRTALVELAERVTVVLGLAGSGVSVARDGRLELDAAHGLAIAAVERAQEHTQIGPCVTAFRTGEVVAVTDLSMHRDQWPAYCAAAAEVGITSVASLPMRLGTAEPALGALNLYADERREWSADDLAAVAVMTDVATAYLVNASHHLKQVELAEQLQHALDSRVIIEQAKGVLVARHRITPDEAFNRLRRHARSRSVSMTSVADAVVRLRLDPTTTTTC